MYSSASSSTFFENDEDGQSYQDVRSSRMRSGEYEINIEMEFTARKPLAQQYYTEIRRKPLPNPSTEAPADLERDSLITSTEPYLNIISWDGPDDPENPLNFSPTVKFINIALVSLICFITPLASSMFAPGVPALMVEFKSRSYELGSFVVSVYVLGFAIGPLVLAPLSELYGRLIIYHICNVLFLAFTIACGLATNLNMQIAFRFVAGMCGSAALSNGGGTIADMVEQAERGKAMSGFALGPIFGATIGPVIGGFLSQSLGWRWVFWLISFTSGVCSIFCFIFLRETYAPLLLERKTERLRKETGDPNLRSKLDSGLQPREVFRHAIVRPARLLIFSPIVLFTSLYIGMVYGYMYLMFTTFYIVFSGTYHFNTGILGLTYLGLGIGAVLGVTLFSIHTSRAIKTFTTTTIAAPSPISNPNHKPFIEPEFRLSLMTYTAPLIPIGLLIYAWTTHYHIHWIAPLIATSLIGIGNLTAFLCILTYLVDAFEAYAASVLAANSVIRSAMAGLLPLCGQKMYKSLGLGWGSTLLALVAFALMPVPLILGRYGFKLRKRFEIKDL